MNQARRESQRTSWRAWRGACIQSWWRYCVCRITLPTHSCFCPYLGEAFLLSVPPALGELGRHQVLVGSLLSHLSVPWMEPHGLRLSVSPLQVWLAASAFFLQHSHISALPLHHVSVLHQLMYHKGNLKNNYFVLAQFVPYNECLPLCGQALISMPFFVLVWKRNRSAKQTEQEWWKTKHLFFRPRSPGKHSHICQLRFCSLCPASLVPLHGHRSRSSMFSTGEQKCSPYSCQWEHNEMSVLKYPNRTLIQLCWNLCGAPWGCWNSNQIFSGALRSPHACKKKQ